ncbi:MAG: glycosyl hydrolase 108 family protein [Pseudomonadales bacterium]
MADFEPAVTKTLIHEGGATLVDDPADKGGLTRFGISQHSYPELDIRKLTEAQAREIYKRDYWDKIQGDRIARQTVAESIFDSAVNMGPRTAARLTQLALGMEPVDGIIGNNTQALLQQVDEPLFLAQFALAKIARYAHICQRNASQKRFLLGWINRSLGGIA